MSEFYIPTDGREQLSIPRQNLIQVTHSLARRVRSMLQKDGIVYTDSKSRTKSEKRMIDKINARGGKALADVHGLLFIMEEERFNPAYDLLREIYPTPDAFPSGADTLRDRRDPKVRRTYNSASDNNFRPMTFNILIPNGARIAEVQLMTAETYKIGREIRAQYVMIQNLLRVGILD